MKLYLLLTQEIWRFSKVMSSKEYFTLYGVELPFHDLGSPEPLAWIRFVPRFLISLIMENYYHYRVEAKLVEDQEEKMLVENVKNTDLYYCRADAFDFFDDILNKYFVQFKGSFSLLEPYIKIIFIKCSHGYDFDDGIKINTKREETYPLYSLSAGQLKKYDKTFELEIEVFKEHNVLKDSFTISDLYEYTAENSFISALKIKLEDTTLFGESERIEKYEVKECCKCRKNMEISKTLIYNNFKYNPKYVRFACKSCISNFYSSALDVISKGVYDNYGHPVSNLTPKLF